MGAEPVTLGRGDRSLEHLPARDVALLLLASAPLFVGLGAGLHGSEARWLFVSQGLPVVRREARAQKKTFRAHRLQGGQ